MLSYGQDARWKATLAAMADLAGITLPVSESQLTMLPRAFYLNIPEELADATLERVLEKLCEGAKVTDLGRYSFGVAKNIFFEYLRSKRATLTFIDEHKYQSEPINDEATAVMRERQLACLEECMKRLKERDRKMLLDYYQFKGRPKLDQRKKMAAEMNITREVLALRIFHLKQKLKKCVSERLEEI